MTKQQIIKNNKLIAEFDGWATYWNHPYMNKHLKWHQNCFKDFIRYTQPKQKYYKDYLWELGNNEVFAYRRISFLRYNISWDWLMPVIEKIESLQFRFEIAKNEYCIKQFIEGKPYKEILYQYGYSEKSKIERIYLGVIDFIKWYNQKRSL